jgi:hypothetical protein
MKRWVARPTAHLGHILDLRYDSGAWVASTRVWRRWDGCLPDGM